ncbi:putative COPI associated protein [Monocercomonoides exilis]|uniref:putative COPI associated protein n=1 Tax=Monocercomonoides exilis TaxID=2049356 RepID=UPI003559A7D7|nr:putative COPI associated protein [Monocercomonoides exilis]|eukprot:MONOS_11966.1-p1 / transcript=MONOS_11966.1 / gene=MONOS_11966 / organism=Monocercomonoides_exilis_PA203 / gene_product=unspecified product / transcript_product=unspecified product / location=Mono_scaffold00631:23149-24116(-) / protein_length=265 / sequence_SO=supercontig / SO=protein_coding / is_pseudo=false
MSQPTILPPPTRPPPLPASSPPQLQSMQAEPLVSSSAVVAAPAQATYPTTVQQNPAPQKTSSTPDYFAAFLVLLKTLVLITGPLLIAVGILSFAFFKTFRLVSIFFGLYLIFFGGLIFFAEFKWYRFLKSFPFLLTRAYRAIFMAFAGSLSFGVEIGGQKWPGIATGIWSLVIGIVYFIVSLCKKDEDEQAIKEKFKQDNFLDDNSKAALSQSSTINQTTTVNPYAQQQMQMSSSSASSSSSSYVTSSPAVPSTAPPAPPLQSMV